MGSICHIYKKENWKIINNEYKIIPQAYSEIPIKIFNKNDEEIDLI